MSASLHAAHQHMHEVRGGRLVRAGSAGEDSDAGIEVGSDRWFEWLEEARSFSYAAPAGRITLRKERRRQSYYWYAYAKAGGHTRKKYVGRAERLTPKRLDEIAERLCDLQR